MEPQSKPTTPVMDVAPPAKAPAQDVVAAPPPEPVADKPAPPAKTTPPKPKPSQPKQHNGVGMAIVATVIIVLGLAALATFAYLKQNNSL